MKKYFVLSILILTCFTRVVFGQKPLLTDTSYKFWTKVDGGLLSEDGRYASYVIHNQPLGKNTLVVTATNRNWSKRFVSVDNANFSLDSRYLFIIKDSDSLLRVTLNSNEVKFIDKCSKYELYTKGDRQWLIYQQQGNLNFIAVHNINDVKKFKIPFVKDYVLNNAGESIVYKTIGNHSTQENLHWLDLASSRVYNIFSGEVVDHVIFDIKGNQLAFTTGDESNLSIHTYTRGQNSARLVANSRTEGIGEGMRISVDDIWMFNKSGNGLFFTFGVHKEPGSNDLDNPEIWNYQDQILHSDYVANNNDPNLGSGRNLTFLNIKNLTIKRLLKDSERLFGGISTQNGNVLVVQNFENANHHLPSYTNTHVSYSLLFVNSDSVLSIKQDCKLPIENMLLSPDEKFLIYYDPDMRDFISLNILNKVRKNVTSDIAELGSLQLNSRTTSTPIGIVRWLPGFRQVILQGSYDLWIVDIDKKKPARNLTNGDKHIVFSMIAATSPNLTINLSVDNFVVGVDLDTKQTGIYVMNLLAKRFVKLYSGNFYTADLYLPIHSSRFQVAKTKRAFLFKFERVDETPNYVFTNDFKSLIFLSRINPEKKYNWMSSELLTYTDSSGNSCQGVLYKPEDFDPHKKYPVLFSIYQEQSSTLNQFILPDPSGIGINIPLLVSNGYLIFEPNMYVSSRRFEDVTRQSIFAGINALSKLPWVDTSRMCLSGHSLGGWETSYIVTQTNKFKAAIAASGSSSVINSYNDLWAFGRDKHKYFSRIMGGSLEDLRDSYVNASPIINSEKIQTPILMMHNRDDLNVQFYHSQQMFIQLRSMQKATWLISYPKERHIISNEKSKLDYQTKVKGFLDYYLKGSLMPQWMDNPIKY